MPFCTQAQPNTDDLNLGRLIEPADSNLFVRDSLYYNWCNSIIKGNDGNYHLFYARWPKSIGFYSWLTHSEIAHSVSPNMEGPYGLGHTVLQSRKGYWDAISVHNVKVEKFNKLYYLYYTSTNYGGDTISEQELRETAITGYAHKNWLKLRNNQRAGVAISSSLDGEWKRSNSPLIYPEGPIKNVTVNPAVCKGHDGRYYMIIKGDDSSVEQNKVIQAVATSKKPNGPFKIEDKPAFNDIATEDVSVWYDKKRQRYYGIFHAHKGDFIGLITSVDGINWNKATHYIVCKKEIPLNDGRIMKVDRMERPSVYIENDEPKLLSFGVKKGNDAFIVIFKLLEKES